MKNLKFEYGYEEGIIYDNYLWTVTVEQPWLCKINLSDFTVEFVGKIPDKSAAGFSYKVVAQKENIILLMPITGDCIFEYDIAADRFEKRELKNALKTNGTTGGATFKFRTAIRCEDIVWMLPQAGLSIIEYNLKTKEVIEHTEWYEEIKNNHWKNRALFGKGITAKNSIWLPCLWTNAVLEFEPQTKSVMLHRVGNEDNCFEAIAFMNEKFWLIDNVKRAVFSWNGMNDVQLEKEFPKEYGLDEVYSKEYTSERTGIFCMFVVNNKLIFMPLLTNQIMSYDTDKRHFDKIADKTAGTSFTSLYQMDSEWICVSQTGNEIMSFSNKQNERVKNQKIILYMNLEDVLEDNLIAESQLGTIAFLRAIEYEDGKTNNTRRLSVGKSIYKNISR